ncbi:MAG: toll/interleukin-1 receptor domain-containing protein [Deltaproteobacteria bacterium]|nr:toll/interleukin-1 receptor domain-containing protein [Deltaproteobacteria bacterium]
MASRLLARILDARRTLDYLALAALGVLPMVVARQVGAWDTQVARDSSAGGDAGAIEFVGYADEPAFLAFPILAPLILFVGRWVLGRIAPVAEEWPPSRIPPIVGLVPTAHQPAVYERLRETVLRPALLFWALGITLVVQFLDALTLLQTYFTKGVHTDERDFAVFYLAELDEPVSLVENIVFSACAYLPQVSVIFIGALFLTVVFNHNLFFLKRIYRRSAVAEGEDPRTWFRIDLEDVDRCFGFRAANDAFNAQVLSLGFGGIALSLTRLSHARDQLASGSVTTFGEAFAPLTLFPDMGQAFVPINWFLGLCIVAMPALVKLLPLLPGVGDDEVRRNITTYLAEFLPPEEWRLAGTDRGEEITGLAARFAGNAFWPTGNNRASVLFFLSFAVFLVTAFAPVFAVAAMQGIPYLAAGIACVAVLAWVLQVGVFWLLNRSLFFVDERLVNLPSTGVPETLSPLRRREKLPAGVFLSYRRSDAVAYAGRLHDSLREHFEDERIFMDLDDIGTGEDFVHALDAALESVKAMVVLIGPTWETVENEGGRRLLQQGDWVRAEVARGLASDILVVPVLVGGARFPDVDDLPEELRDLGRRNALEVTDTRWAYDVGRLIEALRESLEEP